MVSLIIPHYNRSELLIKNLCDMEIIRFPGVEVLVIDDNSDSQQLLMLRDFLDNTRAVRLIENKKNLGPGYCRNIGLEMASSEYVLFLDSDDRINLYELIRYEQFLKQGRADGIVFYNFLKSSQGDIIYKYDKFNLLNLKLVLNGISDVNNVPVSCLILRKQFLLSKKIFFPIKIRKSEDTIFKFRLNTYSPRLLHSDSRDWFFCWNDEVDSLTRNVNSKKRIQNYFYTIRGMFYLYPLILRNNDIGWFTPFPRLYNSILGIARTIVHYLKDKLS